MLKRGTNDTFVHYHLLFIVTVIKKQKFSESSQWRVFGILGLICDLKGKPGPHVSIFRCVNEVLELFQ